MIPLSLYIHIPYCRQACSYCDFYFVISPHNQDVFFTALQNEITLFHRLFFQHRLISTIYFGGGTPSWVSPHHIVNTLQLILSLFGSDRNVIEITLEANPDDLNDKRLDVYCQAGVNRISLGIQSFHPATLQYLGRSHDQHQAESSLLNLKKAYQQGKLVSWSADLIYGVPVADREWKNELKKILEKSPPHLSIYGLTIEPHTSLAYQIKEKKKTIPGTEKSREEYLITSTLLKERGYDHYEISNYALKDHRSRHNSRYWEYADYWGVGPGAHSFLQGKRFYNLPRLKSYIDNFYNIDEEVEINFLNRLNKIQSKEVLTQKQHYNEYLMVGLRTSQGIEFKAMEERFPNIFSRKNFISLISHLRDQKLLLIEEGERVTLTEKGWLLSDTIFQQLFI